MATFKLKTLYVVRTELVQLARSYPWFPKNLKLFTVRLKVFEKSRLIEEKIVFFS